MFLQTEAKPALEWQLICSSPSKEGHCSAKALLHRLQINPPSLTTDLPPLQPVPLTVTVQVRDVRLHLLVETADAGQDGTVAEELGQTVGMVYITSLQVTTALTYSQPNQWCTFSSCLVAQPGTQALKPPPPTQTHVHPGKL